MTIAASPQANLKLNFNDRDYEFQDLPQKAQSLLKDIARIDQQIGQLQFELRHLQTARDVYGTALRTTMIQEGQSSQQAGADGAHQDATENDHHE